MHDAVSLEGQDRPVVITHPLSTLSDEEIMERAQQAADQAVKIWLGQA